jgi:hypothetical protein
VKTYDRPLAAASAYVITAALAGTRHAPTMCPYRLLAGRACPLCGLTRSSGRAARLDLTGARAMHRAGPTVGLAVATLAVVRLAVVISSSRFEAHEVLKQRTQRGHPIDVKGQVRSWDHPATTHPLRGLTARSARRLGRPHPG